MHSDVVVIIGAAGAGKDTAAEGIIESLGGEMSFQNLKFAAPLKDMCANLFGWDRVRLDTDLEYKESVARYPNGDAVMRTAGEAQTRRQILQHMGTDIMRNQVNDDVWLQAALVEAEAAEDVACFIATDCRFHNELAFLENNFFGMLVIRVLREGDDVGTAASAHVSERQQLEMEADVEITAPAGDVDSLREQVVAAVRDWQSL